MNTPIYIASAKRTPIGSFQGCFKNISTIELGAHAIKSALDKNLLKNIDEVFMGCVLSAGLRQAPARQASIKAGISQKTGCTTINKVCGSGMKAMMLAVDSIKAGSNDCVVAGGMESMTRAPHLLPSGRCGIKYGHGTIIDHLAYDGLEDAYDQGKAMGVFAENCATHYGFTRKCQDEFAIASVERAIKASESGYFAKEIAKMMLKERKSEVLISKDEKPGLIDVNKIPLLRSAFTKDGTVTAASSSALSDGAAATIIISDKIAQKENITPMARIIGHTTNSIEPKWFTRAPVQAIKDLMDKNNWQVQDIDLFEINEAFAVVPLVAMQELQIPHEKVNIYGGAIALGHPIGASGTRIVVTLLNALRQTGGKRGIASLCIGGGEATALAVELVV